MPRKPVKFLNKTYETQKEFTVFVRKIIYDEIGICDDILNIYPDKYKILIKILERHPDFQSKSKNMCNIKIQRNKYNTGNETIIIRDNGEIDIAWHNAITGKHKPEKESLMSAMRSSIDPQIYEFRTNCKIKCCELCGSVERLQVDHNDTKKSAFDELAYNFVMENNMEIPDNFGELNDGTHRYCFLEKNSVFRDKWIKYHRLRARLRLLCRNCNLSRKKTKIKLVL
jgi:hypothetical protein